MAHASDAMTVALVLGAGEGVGREVALRLAAAGARVVVGGRDEHAVAGVVGEITCGGGVARHVAGDSSSPAYLQAAVKKALESFGSLTLGIAVCSDSSEMTAVLDTVGPHLAGRRLLATTPDDARAAMATFGRALPPELAIIAAALDLNSE